MKKTLILLILLGLLVGCTTAAPEPEPEPVPLPPQTPSEEPAEPVNEEHLNALRQFAQRSASEIFGDSLKNENYSPISLQIALSMLVQGADGQTKDEILETMGLSGADVDDVTSLMKSLIANLAVNDEEGKVLLANALFSEESFPMKESFAERLRQDFHAMSESLPLKEKSSVERINAFIEQNTADKIKDAYAPSEDSEAVLVLINTLYANLPWISKFSEDATESSVFHTLNGDVQAPFMHQQTGSSYLKADTFEAASLRLGNHYKMTFVLPSEGMTPQDLLKKEGFLETLKNDMNYSEVKWSLPKFTYSASMDLVDRLKSLGMEKAFRDDAEFPGISEIPTLVSGVIQKSFIDLNEEGVEAAAVTIISVEATAAPPAEVIDFTLDRPFLYLLESHDGVVLFIGIVQDPTAM